MTHAREALAGKWGLAIGATLVYYLIFGFSNIIPFLPLFLNGPMTLGMSILSLKLSRNEDPKFEQIFEGFKRFGAALVASLLMTLYAALWTLLLIIPGIIAMLSYALTFYILADDNSINATEAIRKSKKMMMGHKWELFCLIFRFTGWILISILTFGIGLLWTTPYMHVSFAKFYDEIKGKFVA